MSYYNLNCEKNDLAKKTIYLTVLRLEKSPRQKIIFLRQII